MSKRSFRGKPKKSKAPAAGDLMAQFSAMQNQMKQAQQSLEDELTTVTVGGGAVTVVITGHQRVKSIAIKPEILDPEEVEMLQDLLVVGINQAIEQSQTMAAQRMEGITGGLDINDLLGGMGMGM